MKDKFKTNKHAKQMKAENEKRALKLKEKDLMESCENLYNKMGTEESVEMIKDSLWRWNGKELSSHTDTKVFFTGLIIGFALGILFFHVFLVMPILANLSAPHY